ncbi:hypothetical protein LZ016_10550 [Sphingomonas sp. SM33]|uniref:Uncharacterized protein n=1 Tax=Sphingomonas telluris TaxID=2907998 RepID=A0ABS9VNI4_9SPHN|nr:hypothetical protein [Sphingomonas telluris]MCH8616537.1 hypothetical protein [Sphingomonas telluris]
MSRAVFLNMSERDIILHCESAKIGVSAIGRLPMGGTRLVCMSVAGAGQIRRELKSRLMKADLATERHGPGGDFVSNA